MWRQPMSSAERIMYERREISVDSKVFVAVNPNIAEGDRLEMSDGNYIVRGVVDQAGTGEIWRLNVEKVR